MLGCVVVSPFDRFKNSNMLLNMALLSNLGYRQIELTFPNAAQINAEEFQRHLQTHRLQVSALGTGKIYGEDGFSFHNKEPKIVREAVDRVKQHMDFLDAVAGDTLILGLIRGKNIEAGEKSSVSERFVDIVRQLSDYAGNRVKIAIEPINRYETNFINTVEEGLAILEKIACSNVGLLLDTFHMNIEEVSPLESIRKAKDVLFHIHIADSNRQAPGWGHLDFFELFETLDRVQYRGAISAEILPIPDFLSAARQTYNFCEPILGSTSMREESR